MTDVILAFLADYWLSLLSVICLLVISAFFSGSETALTAASRSRMMFSTAPLAAEVSHQTDYSIRLAGLPLARASFHTEVEKNRYTISGTLNSSGLADIISHTTGQTRVSGVIDRDHLRASEYSMRCFITYQPNSGIQVSSRLRMKKGSSSQGRSA